MSDCVRVCACLIVFECVVCMSECVVCACLIVFECVVCACMSDCARVCMSDCVQVCRVYV